MHRAPLHSRRDRGKLRSVVSQPSRATLAERSRSVLPPREVEDFLATSPYRPEALLIDEITALDRDRRRVEAVLDSTRALPFSALQRVGPGHPAHVSGAELVMATAALGFLHAYFIHACRFDAGWVGFGNRIHRADFKRLATIGPPIELVSQETRTRVGPSRTVLRLDFEFRQASEVVYLGDQSAMFVKGHAFDGTSEAESAGAEG